MILPKALMKQYKKICGTFPCPVSKTTQAILADFIHKGYFEKHLNRMRKIYKGKHDFLLTQIQKYLPAPCFLFPETMQVCMFYCTTGDHAPMMKSWKMRKKTTSGFAL